MPSYSPFVPMSDTKPFITEAELKAMVEVSHEEGVLEVNEREMIQNVFEFNDTIVKEVMVQRTDIVAIEKNSTYEEVMNVFKEEQFSRIPVYRETRDDIIGILNLKDLLLFNDEKKPLTLQSICGNLILHLNLKKIDELFTEMKKKRVPIAIVMNEYGGTSGIITIEDLVEEIVGEIEDEYDDDVEEIHVIKEDEYIINGTTKLELVNEMIGTNIESEEVDTIGGFIINQLGRLSCFFIFFDIFLLILYFFSIT